MKFGLLPHLDTALACDLVAADLVRHDLAAEVALSHDEQARVGRLVEASARTLLAYGLGARRLWLAEQLGIPPDAVTLARTSEGQPLLAHHPELAVSVSRSGTWSALALGMSQSPIGIDLETIRPMDWRPMLTMICAPEEHAEIAENIVTAPGEPRFLRLWTLKEAVLKATGRGFGANAKLVRVTPTMLAEPGAHLIRHDTEGAFLAQWLELEGCIAALAVAQTPRSESRTHIGSTS